MLGGSLEPLLGGSLPINARKRTGPTTQEVVRIKRGLQEQLRAARVSLGLEEVEVARELGITLEKYKAFESHAWPPHHLIPRLCQILKICAGELYGTHRASQ